MGWHSFFDLVLRHTTLHLSGDERLKELGLMMVVMMMVMMVMMMVMVMVMTFFLFQQKKIKKSTKGIGQGFWYE